MAYRRNTTYSERPDFRARQAHARGDRQFRTYDTSYIAPKKSKGPKIAAIIIVLVILGLVIFGATKLFSSCSPKTAKLLSSSESATIEVESGETASDIGKTLVAARLISDSKDFTKYVSSKKLESKLKPGTYVFSGGTTVAEIAEQMAKGPLYDGTPVTVPEGSKLSAIAKLVEQGTNGKITAADFQSAASDASKYATDYSFLKDAGNASLEGFLFPKTYGISSTDTADSVIRKMLDQFQSEVKALDYSYAKSKGLSEYDVVILASIVEKESTQSTRGKVAGVFYNRLTRTDGATAGFLQSDATTAYEVGHDPTAEEVHADTPYSTYTNKGLPPTPICSPGIEALKAVCNPEESDYFYFFFANDANGNIQYFFSETYEEHQAVIAQH